MLWLASIVKGNSQQAKIARGPEILSIRKNELEKSKLWVKTHVIKNVVRKPWPVVANHKYLGGIKRAVKNIENQAEMTVNIAGGSGFLSYRCRGSELWQLLERGLVRLHRLI